MGFMEQRGRGWLIMRREMRAFNATEPELLQDERNRFVRVTFHLDPREGERTTPKVSVVIGWGPVAWAKYRRIPLAPVPEYHPKATFTA